MLYLAEVQRKARVIGGGRAEFRLLACQRSELSWNAVPGEEIIPAPDDVSYGAGVLVLIDLSPTKQIQRHTEAGRQLVSILQNFSRLQDKSKNQGEEIEQWKQSLTYQSQELNRREMEIEARQEELQQLEEEFERLEQQRQEIEQAKADADRLREEFERKSQELEGAWAQLRGAENRLEERMSELQQSSVLDEGKAYQLQNLLNRIAEVVAPTDSIQEQLHGAFDLIAQHQDTLGYHWQQFEQFRSSADQLQAEANQQVQDWHDRWQAWQDAALALAQARADLQAKQDALAGHQHRVDALTQQLHSQEALYQQVAQLNGISDKVNLEALEKLSIEELQHTVTELEADLAKMSRFVHSQEEELVLQQQTIQELRQQIEQASEYDRLRLDAELTDEQDRYQMLNETLVGQRRNLLDRMSVLKQHRGVLARRQGLPIENADESSIDLSPILHQIDQMRQQQTHLLEALHSEVQQLQTAIATQQTEIEKETQQLHAQRQNLRQQEQDMRSQLAASAELAGKVNLYQDTLQPLQDHLDGLKQRVELIAGTMVQFQEASTYQHQSVGEMREMIGQLTNVPTPELAAS